MQLPWLLLMVFRRRLSVSDGGTGYVLRALNDGPAYRDSGASPPLHISCRPAHAGSNLSTHASMPQLATPMAVSLPDAPPPLSLAPLPAGSPLPATAPLQDANPMLMPEPAAAEPSLLWQLFTPHTSTEHSSTPLDSRPIKNPVMAGALAGVPALALGDRDPQPAWSLEFSLESSPGTSATTSECSGGASLHASMEGQGTVCTELSAGSLPPLPATAAGRAMAVGAQPVGAMAGPAPRVSEETINMSVLSRSADGFFSDEHDNWGAP
jgi:hypothetical protein